MQTNDKLKDAHGSTWTVGKLLGQGTWGRTWLVRDDLDREAVLKAPPERFDSPEHRAWIASVREEQLALLQASRHPWLPPLISIVDGHSWIIPRYSRPLAERPAEGSPLGDALLGLQNAANSLQKSGVTHGNLHPNNVFIERDGSAVLTDPLTPAALRQVERLRPGWHPVNPGFGVGWDTFALTGLLQGLLRPAGQPSPMDKLEASAYKDQLTGRLKAEGANPRFVLRLAEAWVAVLRRGLSESYTPSPPYRFATWEELLRRLTELHALMQPQITEVGKVLFAPGVKDGIFAAGQPVTLSISINTDIGTQSHEDIALGLRLINLDTGARVPLQEPRFDVKPHPSGRLRYELELNAVAPGRYELDAHFRIQDALRDGKSAQTAFEVRPQAGYVPPAEEGAPDALDFSRLSRDARGQRPEIDPPSHPGVLIDSPFAKAAAPPTPAPAPKSVIDFEAPSEGNWREPPSVIPFPAPTGFEPRDPDSTPAFPAPVAPTTTGRSPMRVATPPAGPQLRALTAPSAPRAPAPPTIAVATSSFAGHGEADSMSDDFFAAPLRPSDGKGPGIPTHPGEVQVTLSVPPPPTRPTLAPGSTVFAPLDEPPTHPSEGGQPWSAPGRWETLPDPDARTGPQPVVSASFSDPLSRDLKPLDELIDGPPSKLPPAVMVWVERLKGVTRQDPLLLAGVGIAAFFIFAILSILTLRGCA